MVRTYQRKYTNTRNGKHHPPYLTYSEDNLRKAIEAVQNRSLRLKEAAEKYNIPMSTLSRKYRNINCTQEKAGHPTLFSKEEEKSFKENIQLMSHWGFPLDTTDLRVYAQKYLNKIGKTIYGLEDNMPGVDWARNFLNRHKSEISNRTASNISSDRAKTTPHVIDDFFDHYANSVEGVSPDCLINYDETNLTDDPGSKKYIFKRGCKYPERIINSSKSSISLMFAGTADGQSLPIYVVYKAEHLWDQWLEGGPEGTRYNRSKSGWFDSACFEDWFNTVIVPYAKKKPGRKVVIGDNLSSHFSQSVLQTCDELNIAFVCLPPKTTHLLQPLDVAFYAPLKKYWRDVLTKWKKTEGLKHKTLVKSSFPKLLNKLKHKLVENGAESTNLIAGFNKCGLYPINPERPKSRLPQRMIVSEEQIENTTSSVVIDILQEMRSPASATGQTTRKRKCNVPPGMSITAEDLVRNQTEKAKQQHKRKNTQKEVSGNNKNRKSLDEDSNTDSEITIGTENGELNLVDTQPIAGTSGLRNAYDSDSTYYCSDDQRSQREKIAVTTKKPEIGEYISIKGKGKGKKSKQKTKHNQTKISNLEKTPASEKNKSIKGKRKKSKPTIKKRQVKISDLKNLDLDPESIERLIASVKAEKKKKKKTKRDSDSDTTSLSDVMSIHSDSDIIDVDFGEHSSDVKSDDENYECNKDMSTYIRQPTVAEDTPIPNHGDKLIARSCVPDSSVEEKTDGNLKTNYNTKLEYVTDKTSNDPSRVATICDDIELPAPRIPKTKEHIFDSDSAHCCSDDQKSQHKKIARSGIPDSSVEQKTDGNLKTNYNTKLEYVTDNTGNDPSSSATICDDIDLPSPGIPKTKEHIFDSDSAHCCSDDQKSQHEKILIDRSGIPDSSVEERTDGNLKTNYNTNLEYVTDKTSNDPSSSATICDDIDLPAHGIPETKEHIFDSDYTQCCSDDQKSQHEKILIARSGIPDSSVEQKTDGNLKTNYNTKLEYVTDNTGNDLSSSAMISDDIDLPAPGIPEKTEQIQKDEPEFLSNYAVNDHVLVRYCDDKKCKYYIGFIENIKIDGQKYNYTVNFFKTIKKPQLAFRIGKKIDRDEVDDIWIVKKIVLNKNPTNTREFLLAEKSDEMYF